MLLGPACFSFDLNILHKVLPTYLTYPREAGGENKHLRIIIYYDRCNKRGKKCRPLKSHGFAVRLVVSQ